MPDQFGDKTHDATPFRRQKAREQGQVAKSQDLASAVVLVGALMVLLWLGKNLAEYFGDLTENLLAKDAPLTTDVETAVHHWYAVIIPLGRVLLPIMGLFVLIAVMVHLGQIGFLFLPQKLALDISRISPLKGFKRIFSLSNAVRLAFGVFKITVVAGVAVASLWNEQDTLLTLSEREVSEIAAIILELVLWTCMKIGIALFILALLDFWYQRWKHESDLRMTTQELREEMKTTQGDPQILARRRATQRQLVMNRMSTEVPAADVVVTNPTELAIAIRYDLDTMPAPVVVAKGAGVIAQRIRRLALENGIPILERKELARALYKEVDVNQEVPAERYAAVAEVLRYVYELKGRRLPGMEEAA